MDTNKKTGRIIGALFIMATVTSVIGYQVILSPILNAPDILVKVSENSFETILGVLIDSINSIAVIVISILFFPILKKHNEATAIGYIGFRIIESVILIVGHISLLSIVTISQEFVNVAASDTSNFQALGTLLIAVNDWTYLLGPGIMFSFTALILNYSLYRTKLVPRFIAVWGLIGAILLFTADMFAIFGLSTTSTLFIFLILPIGLNEMVLAVWLITKGFDTSALASNSQEQI